LTRARLEAVESGQPQEFRYQPGGQRSEVVAMRPPAGELGLPFLGGVTAVSPPITSQLAQDAPETFELPPGIHFAGEQPADTSAADAMLLFDFDSTEWAAPIVFYPNGRTSRAQIRLTGDGGRFVDVSLRGLTGEVRIGRIGIVREEEPLQ